VEHRYKKFERLSLRFEYWEQYQKNLEFFQCYKILFWTFFFFPLKMMVDNERNPMNREFYENYRSLRELI